MSESAIAKKKEAGMAQLVLVLFAISAVVALVLGLTNMITEPYIKENKQKGINNAMAAVLPADNYEKMTDRYAGGDPTIQDIYSAGDAGWVVQVKPSTSFSGNLTVMVGVDADGACSGISIVSSGETSGLGANASKDYFRAQFVGKSGTVQVAKDGGEIDALTGATITSRGVSEAVTNALAAAESMG